MYKTPISIALFLICLTAAAQPKVNAPETVRQLGIFHQDETISYNFVIKNEGDAPLKIAAIKTSCSCITTKFDKEIAAGNLSKVHVKINVAEFEGHISKNITLLTNDANKPELTLTINATVVSWITITPKDVRFMVMQGDIDDSSQTCIVAGTDGKLFKILRTVSTTQGITASFCEATPAQRLPGLSGNQWAVTIKLNNDVGIGPISDYVTLITDHPRQKEIKIPLSGVVRPMFRMVPSKVDFGQIINVKDIRKIIFIRANSLKAATINITTAESSVKGINISIKPTANKNEYELEITADSSIPKGVFNGTIMVHTNSNVVPVVAIDIKGEVL